MKSMQRPGLVLVLVTAGWLVLSGWMSAASPATPGERSLIIRGASPTEEPPPPRSLWERFSEGASSLIGRHDHDPAAETLRRMGVPAWHQAGLRGKGVKIAILDSGFRGYRKALGKVLP